jgi:hypothetical protein
LSFAERYLAETAEIVRHLPTAQIEAMAEALSPDWQALPAGFRGFRRACEPCAADFRKLCGIEAGA